MDIIDHDALFRLFERLDDALRSKQTICVIGAAAVLCAGHRRRQTQDIDVWRPASMLNDRDLAEAVASAGLGLNPTDLDVDRIYLQTISPGVVQLPSYDGHSWSTGAPSETLWQGHKLTVVAPPAAIVVAAKLVRADDRDLDDCAYLIAAKRLRMQDVREAVAKLPDAVAREAAADHIVLLSLMEPDERPSREDEGNGPER